jgi:transketolase
LEWLLLNLEKNTLKLSVLMPTFQNQLNLFFFAKKYPERFFEMGIQEANMIGVAAGLSFAGKIPFICSFAAFITGRYDQIRMSIGYSNANVKIIGTHSGVGIGEDGHSQMGLEDVSLMRAIPNMVVLQPGDHEETNHMMEWAINHSGPVYLRLTRQDLKQFHIKKFTPGIFPLISQGENSQCAFFSNRWAARCRRQLDSTNRRIKKT